MFPCGCPASPSSSSSFPSPFPFSFCCSFSLCLLLSLRLVPLLHRILSLLFRLCLIHPIVLVPVRRVRLRLQLMLVILLVHLGNMLSLLLVLFRLSLSSSFVVPDTCSLPGPLHIQAQHASQGHLCRAEPRKRVQGTILKASPAHGPTTNTRPR